jgi:hypothetical protein
LTKFLGGTLMLDVSLVSDGTLFAALLRCIFCIDSVLALLIVFRLFTISNKNDSKLFADSDDIKDGLDTVKHDDLPLEITFATAGFFVTKLISPNI